MELPFSDENPSQEAISRARIQRDLFSAITSMKRSKMANKNIRQLEKYLRNPLLDMNFRIDGISPLDKAVSEWRVLGRLLQCEGIDLNLRNHGGRTSIFFAVECSQTESLMLLINKGALFDLRDNEGRTSLSLAAELGKVDHVRILVESKADISSADSKGWTPVFWAVSRQHLETTRYLLSNRDLDSARQDFNGRSLLAIAAETGNAEIVRCLVDARSKGRPMVGVERDLILWATFQRDALTVQLLLDVDKSLVHHRVKGRTPLSMAIELGDDDLAKLFIDAGADVHALDEIRWPGLRNWSFESYLPPDDILLEIEQFCSNLYSTHQAPLLLAAEFQCARVMRMLLDANADVNTIDAKQWTALAWAVEKRHTAIVELLLNTPGIQVDSRDATGRTPLIMAASLGEISVSNRLLESNAAINAEDEEKWTSLCWAASNGHDQAVEFLLRVPGVCVDHKDRQGRTPFSIAAKRGFIHIMHLLINNGADPHLPDKEGHSGFWWFLSVRRDSIDEFPNRLIRSGLDRTVNPFDLPGLIWSLPTPNNKDQFGRTWISWAAEYGDDDIVGYFLEDEADTVDVNIRDGNEDTFSRTPLIWALEGQHTASVDLLKREDTISLHLLVDDISSIEQGEALGLVTSLLRAGYKPNLSDQKGRTPLHLACLRKNRELVSVLIEAGADLESRDHTGKTPLQYALEAQSKSVVDLLLSIPSIDLEPVSSREWFAMGRKETHWVQITQMSQKCGLVLELIDDLGCDWLPRAKETRLCICDNSLMWSLLPLRLDVREELKTERCYWNYAQRDFRYLSVTYISITFPHTQGKPWGVAWTSRETAEGMAFGFISMLSCGWVPKDPSEFFERFLKSLHRSWKRTCSDANSRIEVLRREQVRKRGRSYGLVNELAKNALERAELRQCLQSHIEGLLEVVTTNISLEMEQRSQLRELVDGIEQTVIVKLDNMEQAVRDILQIELAWVSTNEAASFKRLSWVTFIFLPLMFVSSLFGMNVNLLQDNPDWKWYIFFGGVSLIMTGILWLASKFIPVRIPASDARQY
ncbi:hypothetical protein N7540_011120 [Penicillium herquei]|nr:hypothetical protein N7540_011120 [Penicillium herquei]